METEASESSRVPSVVAGTLAVGRRHSNMTTVFGLDIADGLSPASLVGPTEKDTGSSLKVATFSQASTPVVRPGAGGVVGGRARAVANGCGGRAMAALGVSLRESF